MVPCQGATLQLVEERGEIGRAETWWKRVKGGWQLEGSSR